MSRPISARRSRPYRPAALREHPRIGIDDLAPPRPPVVRSDGLRLLHVGRAVRTKGLRDVIRALARLGDRPGIRLVSAGDGEDLAACRREAEALGVADRVRFEGRVPRERVSELYEEADVFVFPSFREPAGGVLYEAMRAGLPVVTVAYGGPNFIVDDASGIRLGLSTPEALADDVAAAVRRLDDDPALRQKLGRGARARVAAEGLWERKNPPRRGALRGGPCGSGARRRRGGRSRCGEGLAVKGRPRRPSRRARARGRAARRRARGISALSAAGVARGSLVACGGVRVS